MKFNTVDQIGMDETIVEDPDLERALDDREEAKDEAARTRRLYAEQDAIVQGKIEQLELTEGPVRVGRYRIAKVEIPARAVSFETEATARISISAIGEE